MKFARYLRDAQAPEWKRAYIDYRGLKKKITAIKRVHEKDEAPSEDPMSEASTSHNPSVPHEGSRTSIQNQIPVNIVAEGSSGPQTQDRPLARSKLSSIGSIRLGKARVQRSLKGVSRNTSTRSTTKILPLHVLREHLTPQETAFVDLLDSELEKIESFYQARESEMVAQQKTLQEQLVELAHHRQRFYAAHPKRASWFFTAKPGACSTSSSLRSPEKRKRWTKKNHESSNFALVQTMLDQEEYQNAKKQLKKAIAEHYRALETLNNYRILNITGIRKALKKFEKVTEIPILHTYMSEKIESGGFGSIATVSSMMKEMEDLYAEQFFHGDRKRTMNRLRGATHRKTHHLSSFRSGTLLGLAVPALASGLYFSFQEATRDSIEGWDVLLMLYGIVFVPTLFVLLVGTNLLGWTRGRINYVFIFELDTRSRLDYREYFEVPTILFAALCYAFWLSFAQIGAPTIAPDIWLLLWLGLVGIVVLNPFPVGAKSSRYWLLKKAGKLLLSGATRVEFADFWLGDQFCSLIFTLSNLPFLICAYSDDHLQSAWARCSGTTTKLWPISYVLASLPFIIRLVQSARRYADAGLNTHLINAGKYAAGFAAQTLYFVWRHQGGRGRVFILWCIVSVLSTLYATVWDFLMDWSIFGRHSAHPLLRKEIVYTNHIPLYYIAILSNIIIRFTWVIYVPAHGPPIPLRSFVAGMLEMIRRWQWNFYRLENEHLGNMDQYRITREVPLPYSFDEASPDDEADDLDI